MNSKSTVLTNVKKILILVSLKPSELKADLKQSYLFWGVIPLLENN